MPRANLIAFSTPADRENEQIEKVNKLWKEACAHDGIEADSNFCAWSENNPHTAAYNAEVITLMEMRRK